MALIALALGIRLCAQSGNSLAPAWQNWRYYAPINTSQGSSGLTAVQLALPTTAHQPAWQDVRVIDDSSREVPFVLHARLETSDVQTRRSRLLEVTYKRGESTQGIVDLGENPAEHNAVEIGVDERDYFLWVEIATSADGRNWRILNERSPIYRFRTNNLDGNQTVRYSPTRSRYLRLRLLDGSRKLPLESVRVTRVERRRAERTRIELNMTQDAAAPKEETWWRADMADSRQPASEVRVEADQPEFHRAVRVSISDDGQQWRTAGQGDVFRLATAQRDAAADEETRERLRVTFPEAQARYWRVQVFNRNDPPLAGLTVNLFGTPRRAVFRVEPGQHYRLLFGNPRAEAAQYDMARLTPVNDVEAAVPASLGTIATNASWVDPAPWSERHPVVLWAAIVAAAGVLGALALQALRGAQTS